MAGYLGFGSFHSDNVEELLCIPSEEYVPPPLPPDVPEPAILGPDSPDLQFGRYSDAFNAEISLISH